MEPFSLTTTFLILVFLLRLLVGGIILIAGLVKLVAPPNHLLGAILGYDLVPKPIAIILARGLPWVELTAGSLLILGLWVHLGVMVNVGLLLIFSGSVAVSLLRGKDNDCGCFQSLTPVQWRLVHRNLVLMGLLLPVYRLGGGCCTLDSRVGLSTSWNDRFDVGLAIIIGIWLLLLIASLMLQQFTQRRAKKA